jgi:diguanylate cyclase (GGDEF)-like protein
MTFWPGGLDASVAEPSPTPVAAKTPDPWEQELAELRVQFLRESVAKLASMDELIEHLAQEPSHEAALCELHRRFHGFAGSGTSYGLPAVSLHGARGEVICASVLESGRPPGPKQVAEWRIIKEALRHELAPTQSPQASERKGTVPLDVLVVDDDPNLRRIASTVFEHEGMSVRVAADQAQALAEVDKRKPDCIVVDVYLPDGSGYDLVETLRARPDGDSPAVLIVSVRSDFQGRVRAVTAGSDGYFEKPVDWEALLRRLHHVLERTRTEPGRVLSVEDDPEQAQFARSVLESGGYEFRTCSDPTQFEAELVSFKPDLVLMDVNLPGYNGYDLVRYVRQNEKYATLPILFLTTESALKAHVESARAGGDDHLVKPVSPGLLLSTVAARVERARFVKSLLDRDGLTRLLTHTACQERAKALLSQCQRHPARQAAWVMLDLDHFKAINDRYGHPTGDKVLTSLASHLRRRLRQSDTVARYGGEEFVILLEDLCEHDAVLLVSRLLREFAELPHVSPDGSKFHVTFSAGVAMLEPGIMNVERWKQAADDALYRAKAEGRNRIVAAHFGEPGARPLPTPRG